MTRIKICGLTRAGDALDAVEAGADAVGFVFAGSPRRILPADAAAIIRRLPPFVRSVGVFRDACVGEVREVACATGIDVLQFHGSETPDYCAGFDLPVVKTLRVRDGADLQDIRALAGRYEVGARLLDPGGGDGVPFDWELARTIPGPLVIAGGLHAGNVGQAIATCRPYAVDAASRLESAPGLKDPQLVRAFVRAVREFDARHAA